jgi:thiosulfate/3-mercaptopyruvate sulfurtransferase
VRNLSYLSVIAALTLFFTGCAAHIGTSPKGMEAPIEKAAIKFSSDLKEGGYQVVTTDELRRWLDQGKKMTLISTLPPEDDLSFGRIPSAVNATMPKFEKELMPADAAKIRTVAGNDKETPIVVYCGFVGCRRSHIGAKLLVDGGYRNVYRYAAGIAGWGEAGYPLEK